MKKVVIFSSAALTVMLLSGCGLLYPNSGTNQNPSTPQLPTETATTEPSPSESASPSPTLEVAEFNMIELNFDAEANAIFVVAEVLNAAENDGKCTMTFTSGSVSKSVSVKAEANTVSTQCFPAYIPASELPKGKGNLTVSYKSAKFAGTSKAFGVVIP